MLKARTINELVRLIEQAIGVRVDADLDNEGQVIIYTNLIEDDGRIYPRGLRGRRTKKYTR